MTHIQRGTGWSAAGLAGVDRRCSSPGARPRGRRRRPSSSTGTMTSRVVHPDGSADFCGDLGFDVVEHGTRREASSA